jgi:hypothetical protein
MHNRALGWRRGSRMSTWLDVWHAVLAVVSRQAPFTQVMVATGAVFVLVMALEGVRSSLLAIWHAHKASPPLAMPREEPLTLALPLPAAQAGKSFSPRPRTAAHLARRPKPSLPSPRQFRSPRPQIRRHGLLDFAPLSESGENSLHAPLELSDAL